MHDDAGGEEAWEAETVTFVTRGVFDRDERLQRQFFELVRG